MMLRQLLTAVVSLAVSLTIFGVAFAQDQQDKQKKQGKQPAQKVSSPARPAPAPAPRLQPQRPQTQTMRPPSTQGPRSSPAPVRMQDPRQQPPRPPFQVRPGYQPQRPQSGQTVNPATPTMRPRPVQPPAGVVRPPVGPSVPQGGINAARSPQAPKNLIPQAGPTGKQPSVKSPVAATPQPPSSQASPVAKPGTGQPISSAGTHHQDPQPATSPPKTPEAKGKVVASGEQNPAKTEEVKYKRDPKLANVKWSDNELRDHIKGNLDTLGEKYDKNKYGDMSRKDLEQAYSKIHSQAEKQEKKDKSAKQEPGDKYEKLSRNELEKGIEKELGHKLDKKYDKMSKNELRNELANLKDKDKKQEKNDKKDKSNKAEPGDKYEKLSRNELEKGIEKELGHKLDKKYDKMSKNELANELSLLKEKNNAKQQGQSHSHVSGTPPPQQSQPGQNVSNSAGSSGLQSFRGVLANQSNGQQIGPSQGKPERVNPLSQMKKEGYGWDQKGLPGVKYAGDGPGGVIDGKHNGVDLKASPGTSVKAPEKGYITKATYDKEHGQLTLEMEGESGYKYKFIHMGNNTDLEKQLAKGRVLINAGDPLGVVGDAKGDKWATGPHLHISVMKDGKFVDPDTLFKVD